MQNRMHYSSEKPTMANIKNRTEISQLRTELNRIEREKVNELRMHNNAKQRFKAKYSSHESSMISEASDVKMYETHNPGFCYKRNGEHKLQQVQSDDRPVDFEHLHFLLFTDGEVDIEKVLCLHLLSAHETEHLAPPIKPKTLSYFVYKKYSPLEQLIERSKGKHNEITSSMMFLPTYILDVRGKDNSEQPILIRDGRLSSRLLVNEKILELIATVITTLEKSNPEKLRQLEEIASDPSNLRRIFRKAHILEFVQKLKNHTLIHNCGSFMLTSPFRIKPSHLEVTTAFGYLENLVKFIRKSVLQFPTRATWRRALDEYETSNKSPEKPITSPRKLELKKFRHSSTNFVTKNIVAISNYRTKNAREQITLPNKLKDEDNIKISRRNAKSPTRTKRKICENHPEEVKVHLKQTTCSACMEKWKTPLPSPKISKLSKKNNNEEHDTNCLLKTNSIQRLSTMIERELYKLNSYDRKYSNNTNNNWVLNYSKKNKPPVINRNSLDLIRLDVYDLEKIKQEIREKEAQKKLEKFLDNC